MLQKHTLIYNDITAVICYKIFNVVFGRNTYNIEMKTSFKYKGLSQLSYSFEFISIRILVYKRQSSYSCFSKILSKMFNKILN